MTTYIWNRKCDWVSFACNSCPPQKDCGNLVSVGGTAELKGNKSLSIKLSEMWIRLTMPTSTAGLRKDIPGLKYQVVTTDKEEIWWFEGCLSS